MRYEMDADRHAAIFGAPDPIETSGPGRSRKCRSCGGWHRLDQPWPHNCRRPAPPRNPDLATPRVAPPFEPFKTGVTETAEVIQSRNDKREYMRKHDLVEYDEGVRSETDHWTYEREQEREVAQLIADVSQTDTEYLSNRAGFDVTNLERVDDRGSLDDGTDIEASDIEVIE
ncbi:MULTISPECIES: hypothetical protein [unclassified Mameliella]|uniref:hypothetical protein n=1 Tax=unclassified Mameliella TaxID=2630630 RepID=UPI00273EE765|nr:MULTISPECIES: hypothetical protein [unclassified Mameliella]